MTGGGSTASLDLEGAEIIKSGEGRKRETEGEREREGEGAGR